MISYFCEDIAFKFNHKRLTNNWLKNVAMNESRKVGQINIIFCSDEYELDINKKYLSHDYYTDVITFDYCEGNVLSGDLFISIDSVKDNAQTFGASFKDELDRVIVHGVLHLIGYDDHTDSDQKVMREKENFYLERRLD